MLGHMLVFFLLLILLDLLPLLSVKALRNNEPFHGTSHEGPTLSLVKAVASVLVTGPEDCTTEGAGLPGGPSDGSGVTRARVCSSDLNVLPLWGPVSNADAHAP